MPEDELDAVYEKAQAFHEEFRHLVRKYMPKEPDSEDDGLLLMMMQERTSVYNPWIWAEDYKPV